MNYYVTMERTIINKLVEWKNKKDRKPLILNGARQTGKTWILKEFGSRHFSSFAYIKFDNNETAKNIFEQDFHIKRIISQLSLVSDTEIKPNEALIVFDEIQECPKALTALKYFCEEAPEYFVAAAGSLLGIKLSNSQGTGFPVGKVEYLNLNPMNFKEFLMATGMKKFIPFIEGKDWETLKAFKNELRLSLKKYFIVGGMPEAVLAFTDGENFNKAREIQKRILNDYDNDFSKHAPLQDLPKIRDLWDSVPRQLAKENKRFVYSECRTGGNAKTLENALWWLFDAGLLKKVKRVSAPDFPLSYYEDGAFKLFFLDIGLLCAKSELSPKTILEGNRVFTEFKGALTEQYVNQELRSLEKIENQYYWAGRTSEIDFLVQIENEILPVEVKAEQNLQAKSLKYFCEKFNIKKAYRFSMSDHNTGNYPFGTELEDIPLFAINLD